MRVAVFIVAILLSPSAIGQVVTDAELRELDSRIDSLETDIRALTKLIDRLKVKIAERDRVGILAPPGSYKLTITNDGRHIVTSGDIQNPQPPPVPPTPIEAFRSAVVTAGSLVRGDPEGRRVVSQLFEIQARIDGPTGAQLKSMMATQFQIGRLQSNGWPDWKKAIDKAAAKFTTAADVRKCWTIIAEVLKDG